MIEIGVDIGGTFTDVVLVKDEDIIFSTKVSSTPPNLVKGICAGVAKVLKMADCVPKDVGRFIHGTTVATNAIIEQKGATLGMLLTKGFEDTLETGRQRRERMYDLFMDPEAPLFLCPRKMRLGINERIGPGGEVLIPLNEEEVVKGVRDLKMRFGIQAIVVCYLFSFRNPAHERRTKEILKTEFPDLSISISSEVDPIFREYERLCVTGFDAYLRPVIEKYVAELDMELQRMGIASSLQIMQSRGGITSADVSIGKPITTFLSGPAAGAIAGRNLAEQTKFANLITMDMGGTSCDVALIDERKLAVATDGKIAGYPVRVPMVDVHTIGAGGGSIAWIDVTGGLRVGPQSAGAMPGPVCYMQGGNEPTVTDASMVLGYLNPDFFAGGEKKLDRDASMKAIEALGKRLGLTTVQCAAGIHRVINVTMANLIRLITVRRGVDPRKFALLLMGGGGPVHGGALISELGISKIIVPETPGVLSAFGLLVANIEHDSSRTFGMTSTKFDYLKAKKMFQEMDTQCQKKMEQNNVQFEEVIVTHSADIQYVGQSHTVEVVFDNVETTPQVIERAVETFRERHQAIYGHKSTEDDVEFVNLRAVHSFPLPKPKPQRRIGNFTLDNALKGYRKAYFQEYGEYRETRVYNRYELPVERKIEGPLIIEQADTTTVVYPNQSCYCDEKDNLIIS
jgi:N-methylhydantoinase A